MIKNENYGEEGYIKFDAPIKEENCCDFLNKKKRPEHISVPVLFPSFLSE